MKIISLANAFISFYVGMQIDAPNGDVPKNKHVLSRPLTSSKNLNTLEEIISCQYEVNVNGSEIHNYL